MCNWNRWIWPGLITTALLTMLAGWLLAPSVEADLSAKAGSSLSAGGFDWANVELDGRDLTLSGIAPTAEARDAAAGIVADAYDVRVVNNMAGLLPIEEPYKFSAELGSGGLTLDGFVPNNAARAAIAAVAATVAGGAAITDNMKLARGVPQNYADGAKFGLSQLGRFASGKVSLSDTDYSVEGLASSLDNYIAAKSEIAGGLPSNFKLASSNIVPPVVSPYTWGAQLDGNDLTLTGYVPDSAARKSILAAATKSNSGKTIIDRMKFGSGAAAGFGGAAAYGLSMLSSFSKGKVDLSGADLSVSGDTPSAAVYDTVMMSLKDKIPSGFNVATMQITKPAPKPVVVVEPKPVKNYNLKITKTANVITMTGYVPDNKARVLIVSGALAANPGIKIVDKTEVAPGVPDDMSWGLAGRYAAARLGALSSGSATLLMNKFSIEGEAKNSVNYSSLKKTLAAGLAGGMVLSRDGVKLPVIKPYTWTIDNSDDNVTIGGYVPTMKVADANLGNAVASFSSSSKFANTQKLGGGAPRGFAAATSIATNMVSRLEKSSAIIIGNKLTVRGEAMSKFAANTISTQVKNALPPGFSGEAFLTVREVVQAQIVPPDVCQDILNKYLLDNTILFETAKANISPKSFGLLDRLVFTTLRCPLSRISIEGHTDSDGSEASNLKLSDERAQSVRNYLVKSGILSSRMDAVGFGESDPIADNATQQGKAKNRRIEFRILR